MIPLGIVLTLLGGVPEEALRPEAPSVQQAPPLDCWQLSTGQAYQGQPINPVVGIELEGGGGARAPVHSTSPVVGSGVG